MKWHRPQCGSERSSTDNSTYLCAGCSTDTDEVQPASESAPVQSAPLQRTRDVINAEGLSFEDLGLPDPIVRGLRDSGFTSPSPIQLRAIPVARFGSDVIAQSKAGTGKTCVFAVCILESLELSRVVPQSLVLCPTREIALQTSDTIESLGRHLAGLVCRCIIGGVPIGRQREQLRQGVHVIVGTPGRLVTLLTDGALDPTHIHSLVLDEADQLLDFQFLDDVSSIHSSLSSRKQVFAISATFSRELIALTKSFMRSPTTIRMGEEDPSAEAVHRLEGVRQYFLVVHPKERSFEEICKSKFRSLLSILSQLQFYQCIVFLNCKETAQQLVAYLSSFGWPTLYISGSQSQLARTQSFRAFQQFRTRILVSTDVVARGIDVQKINFDMPRNPDVYLHRVGRTGRFGSYGVSVQLCTESELPLLSKLQESIGYALDPLVVSLLPGAPSASDPDEGAVESAELHVSLAPLTEGEQERLSLFEERRTKTLESLHGWPFKFVNHPSLRLPPFRSAAAH